MGSLKHDYFRRLFDLSSKAIADCPISIEPPLMGYITGTLEHAVQKTMLGQDFPNPDRTLFGKGPGENDIEGAPRSAGLNTTGMLLDRLTILSVKHWNLQHRTRSPEKAEALVDGQITEIIAALAQAKPGSSSINNKMTSHSVEAGADSFGKAYAGLLSVNLLLWEAQEILYNHDIMLLPGEEVRAYISFFSRGNLVRNSYIQSADQLFWRGAE